MLNILTARAAFGAAGCAVLALAASCVPQPPPAPAAAVARPADAPSVAEARALLRGLALAELPAAAALSAPPVAAPPFLTPAASPDDAARAAECLTAAVYYEARSEPLDGQRAVAQVVLNRVRDRAFPNSVCGVVFQGSERRTGCQFTFTCDGSTAFPRDPIAWARSRAVALAALAGAVYAPVGSATHYHTLSVLPWWGPSLTRVAAVGSHLFYRWRGALERVLAFRQSYAGWEPPTAAAMDAAVEDAAVADAAATENGVAVHRGGAAEADAEPAPVLAAAGVAVHRGGWPDVRVHVRTVEAAAPAAEATDPT